jgi:hypothetical protein
MEETPLLRMLRRACDLMGRDLLAAGLRVPPTLLDAWLSGHASIPQRKLLMLADLVEKYRQPKR